MIHRTTILASILGGCSVAATQAAGEPRDPNRFSLNGRFTFEVNAEFTSATPVQDIGVAGALATTPAQAGTIVRDYDDGSIGVDISGNAGDVTTFWSYSDLSQLAGLGTPGGTLSFHSAPSPADQSILQSDDQILPGLDFQYSRDLGSFDMKVNGRSATAWFGVSLQFGYLDLDLAQRASVSAPVALTTDTFAIGAVVPPVAPFQGTVPGPGTLIPDSPASRVTAATPATANTRNEVDGSLYGLTVGAFLEIPFSDRLLAEFNAGLAIAAIDRTYSFTESVAITGVPTTVRSGAGANTDWLLGGMASVGLSYEFAKNTRLRLGCQYQNLGSAGQSLNGKTANIDLESALSVSAGIQWQF